MTILQGMHEVPGIYKCSSVTPVMDHQCKNHVIKTMLETLGQEKYFKNLKLLDWWSSTKFVWFHVDISFTSTSITVHLLHLFKYSLWPSA